MDDAVVGFAICVLHEGTRVTTPICYLEDLVCRSRLPWTGIARTMIKSLQSEGRTKAGRGCTGIRAVIIPPVICMMSLPDDYVRYWDHA